MRRTSVERARSLLAGLEASAPTRSRVRLRRLGASLRWRKNRSQFLLDTSATSLLTGEVDDWFETRQGLVLPVFARYRSSLKSWWRIYHSVAGLEDARQAALLRPDEESFLTANLGTRTLGAPVEEFADELAQVSKRHPERFVGSGGDVRILPDAAAVRARVDASIVPAMLLLTDAGLEVSDLAGTDLLDVGCGEAGYSLPMYERLGCRRVVGIDNAYGACASSEFSTAARGHMATGSTVVRGDMSDGVQVLGFDKFDLVTSMSVLEHVADLEGFFAGMFDVVRPGGTCIHRYEPYFSLRGAHSLGLPDQPWGHLVLDRLDRDVYFRRFRPFEVERAESWFETSLNYASLGEIVAAATGPGFTLKRVVMASEGEWSGSESDLPVLLGALEANPNIGFGDLFTRAVTLVLGRE